MTSRCATRSVWSVAQPGCYRFSLTRLRLLRPLMRYAVRHGNRNRLYPSRSFPRLAAEVVGYARSRRRNDGLHVMVD